MPNNNDILSLQIIAALDSLAYGLVYSFLPTYVLSLGANHLTLGFLSVGILVGELVAQDVMEIFVYSYGRKFTLFFILNLAMVTNLMLVLTNSYTFAILARFLYSSTNQSQNLCRKLLLSKAQNDAQRQCLQSNYSYLSGLGYVVGPIVSGYLFDYGFGYTSVIAALLGSVNAALLLKIKREHDQSELENKDSAIEKAIQKLIANAEYCIQSDFSNNWDLFTIKYLFSGSIIVFCSKFTQLLKANYEAKSVMIGYTLAYINALIFVGTYVATTTKSELDKYHLTEIIEIAFFLMAAFIFLSCIAPYYVIFMFLLVPIIFLRSFIVQSWQDIFAKRKNANLFKLNNSISVCAGMTVPLLFGVTCNAYGYHAVTLFSTIPIGICFVLTRFYSRYKSHAIVLEEDNDSKKDI